MSAYLQLPTGSVTTELERELEIPFLTTQQTNFLLDKPGTYKNENCIPSFIPIVNLCW